MYRLYLDTCILNDAFLLWQREQGGSVHPRDVKTPMSCWAAEYVALYHLLDLDDQWELEFGTSEATLDEISRFQVRGRNAYEKKAFLEDIADTLYFNFLAKPEIVSMPIVPNLLQRARKLLGHEGDAMQICQAVQGGWEFFITTDFRTVLTHQSSIEGIVFRRRDYQGKLWPQGEWEPVVGERGIKVRSPLQFLEQYLLPLPVLIRTLYGSWTDPGEFVAQTGRALLDLLRHGSRRI